MASSASSYLKLELMATGENTSAWGTKTNTNLQIIEAFAHGVTTINTTGGDTTLTDVDYTNDQAKKGMIWVTGTLSSDANIIVPNIQKRYFVYNNTSGAYNVNIKTSGGSAVSITQDTAAIMACDGSNVIIFLTPETDPSTGAVTGAQGATASTITVTPSGNLSSTTAQTALTELQGDIDTINTSLSSKQPLDADLTAIAALSTTKGNLIAGSGSAWGATAAGTDGYVLMADSTQANGIKWASLIPSGTTMLFYQSAAPTGWTGSDSFSDHAIRVVTTASGNGGSSGGSTAFTSVFTSRTILQANLPNVNLTAQSNGAHTHVALATVNYSNAQGGGARSVINIEAEASVDGTATSQWDTESSGAHTHTVPLGGSGTAMDFATAYVSTIVASKD